MGAAEFVVQQSGETVKKAFQEAVEEHVYEYGHGGDSGTIAEKHSFKQLPAPNGMTADEVEDHAWNLLDKDDSKFYHDKWGDCAAFDCGDGKYVFFGTAPE